MNNFTFHNPTRIHFGRGQIAKISDEISKDSKVLITYGGGSIKKNGVYDQVLKSLEGYNIFEFSGIEPNPTYETLMQAVEIVRKEKIDFILAVGGGSVIDGTKFIAAAAPFEGEPWNIVVKGASFTQALPFGTILTLPATGSEMNCGSVITHKASGTKRGFMHPLVFPVFSVLDPETTFTLPRKQISNGVIDAFVHTTEQYLTYNADAPLQDRLAESILQTLIEEGPKGLQSPEDYNARSNIMWCATMALNGVIGAGVPQDWATHMIGHELTAKFNIDHAQTLAIILPSTLSLMRTAKQEKLLQYGERVWGITEGREEERIEAAIEKTREFFESLEIKTRLQDYNVSESDFDDLITKLEEQGMIQLGEHRDITLEKSREILRLSL